MDAEWRHKDPETALAHTASALALEGLGEGLREDLFKRRERLLKKCR
jgi:hypothetical protein